MNTELIKSILMYLIYINIITFVLFFLDKELAKRQMYRISEKLLLYLSVFGGAIGGFLGMKKFKHKTKKSVFKIFIPMFAIIYFVAIIYLIFQIIIY